MFISKLLVLYYLFFVPLIMICAFAFFYRYGFELQGVIAGIKRSILYTILSLCLMMLAIFYAVPASDGGPSGPGDGILVAFVIFPGLIFITFIAYVAFMCGYKKAVPEGYISEGKSLSPYMVSLFILCLLILISGAIYK